MSKPLKIAVFGHKHIFTREGGIEVVVSELYPRLAKHARIDVYDRTELGVKQENTAPKIKNLKIKHSYTIKKRGINAIVAAFSSALQIMFKKYDIVHIHAEGSCFFIPLLKLARKKIVVTIHGLDWQRDKWGGIATKIIKAGEIQAGKHADAIIVLNDDTKNYFKDVYRRDTLLIENGITIHKAEKTEEIEKLWLKPGEYFLYIGRFAPEKRTDLLVDAYQKLTTNTKLVLAGPSPDLDEDAEWFKKASKDPNIVMPGFVEGELLDELYSHCKAFVLPSDLEGMSLSLLEAMGSGAVCITSDIRENVQTLHGFGHTFKAGNADDLSRVMKQVDEDGYRKDEKEAEYVASAHDWDVVAKKTLDVYREVARS